MDVIMVAIIRLVFTLHMFSRHVFTRSTSAVSDHGRLTVHLSSFHQLKMRWIHRFEFMAGFVLGGGLVCGSSPPLIR